MLDTLNERVTHITQKLPPALQPWARLAWRFARFGVVGGSGIAVNQLVLWAGMSTLFASIAHTSERLNYALPLAIAVATTYNFFWNRLWTWRERRTDDARQTSLQFAKYIGATLIGSTIQYFLTRALAASAAPLGVTLHYALANLVAIGVASIANFLINDRVTFRRVD